MLISTFAKRLGTATRGLRGMRAQTRTVSHHAGEGRSRQYVVTMDDDIVEDGACDGSLLRSMVSLASVPVGLHSPGGAASLAGTTTTSILATASTTALPTAMISFLQVAPPVAAQIVFLSPLAAMKQFKEAGTTGDVSPIPYAAMCVNGFLWVVYGGLKGDMTIIAPNASGFLFGAYYVKTFAQYRAPSVNMTPYYGGTVAMSAAVVGMASVMETSAAIDAIGLTGCAVVAVMFGGPLGSIKTVLKDKNTNSLPVPFTVAAFVNCICWASYGWFVIDDVYVYAPNLAGLAASSAQIALYARFGLPRKTDK